MRRTKSNVVKLNAAPTFEEYEVMKSLSALIISISEQLGTERSRARIASVKAKLERTRQQLNRLHGTNL